MHERILANPWLAFAVFCGALISLTLAIQIIYDGGSRLGADFEVFWIAARVPLDQVYAPATMPFVYPPTALMAFKGLALVPFWPSFALWSIAGLALYFWSARTSPLIFVSPVVVQCALFGQTALLLGAAIVAASRARPMICGAVLGFIFAFKPQLVVFAPVAFVVRRDWPGLFSFGAAVIFLCALSLAAFGFGAWLDWVHALFGFRQAVANLGGMVITPFAYAVRFGIDPIVAGVSLITLAAVGAWFSRGDKVELICLTSLLVSPYAGGSDLAPLLAFAFVRLTKAEEPLKVWHALVYDAAFTPVALVIGLYRLSSRGYGSACDTIRGNRLATPEPS